MRWKNCEEITTKKEIPLEEKRTKITFINPSRKKIIKVKVDKCIPFKGKKCDWLLVIITIGVFVELKGSNIKKGIKQLKNSILVLAKNYNLQRIIAYIAYISIPFSSTELQYYRKIFKKETNSLLKPVKTNTKINIDNI